jgi:thiol-disulfide isomerase/thioredoxin
MRKLLSATAIFLGVVVAAGSAAAEAEKGAAAPPVPVADVATIRAAVAAPGAKAVLVNVWATWCDACRDELPDLLRFYRAHRAAGLRLVLISADDEDKGAEVARFLASAGAGDARAFILKPGDDTALFNAFDSAWTGAIPATFLYDGQGKKRRFWSQPVTAAALEQGLAAVIPTDKRTPKGTP